VIQPTPITKPTTGGDLPIDHEFVIAVVSETNYRLPLHPLDAKQVEAVLLTLHQLGEFTPPSWRPLAQTETTEQTLMRLFGLIREETDRQSLVVIAQGILKRQGEKAG